MGKRDFQCWILKRKKKVTKKNSKRAKADVWTHRPLKRKLNRARTWFRKTVHRKRSARQHLFSFDHQHHADFIFFLPIILAHSPVARGESTKNRAWKRHKPSSCRCFALLVAMAILVSDEKWRKKKFFARGSFCTQILTYSYSDERLAKKMRKNKIFWSEKTRVRMNTQWKRVSSLRLVFRDGESIVYAF